MTIKLKISILYLVVGIAILIFYLISTNKGNRMSSDSEWYLAIGENFSKYGEFLGPQKTQIIYWPPLYPTIISLGGSYVLSYIKILHIFSFFLTAFFWILIVRKYISFYYTSIFCLFFCLSTPLLMIHVFIWSEAFFVFFLSGYLFFLKGYLTKNNLNNLFFATIFCFCFLLQRNAGFFIIIPVIISVLLFKTKSPKDLIIWIFHFLIGISGGFIWNFYKLILQGNQHIFGELLPFISIKRNFELVSKELFLLFFPNIFNFWIGTITFIVLGTIGLLIFKSCKDSFINILIFILFFYIFFWIIIPADVDNISRFIAVVLPILYFILTYFLQFIDTSFSGKYNYIILSILIISFIYQGARILHNALSWGGISILSLNN